MKPLYRDAISHAYPEFVVECSTSLPQGEHCDTFLVNEQYVFRFARHRDEYDAFLRETTLLKTLENRLPLSIPAPIFHSGPNSISPPFMGYIRLPGRPIQLHWLESEVSPEGRAALARELASCLSALHTPEIRDTVSTIVPTIDTYAYAAGLFAEIRDGLFGRMPGESQRRVSEHFETFLATAGNFSSASCLRHGDFGPTNILVDDSKTHISGILDFGCAAVGDPAYDLAGVSCLGPAFYEAFGRYYPGFEEPQDCAAFYRGTFALQEALFELKKGDEAALQRGLADYS